GRRSPMPGPNRLEWRLSLAGGADVPPRGADYIAAVEAMSREPAIAVTAFPDLYVDLPFDFGPATPLGAQPSLAVLRAAVTHARELHDRLVLIDLPFDADSVALPLTTDRIVTAVASLRQAFDADDQRAAALYHPPLWLSD